MNKDPIIAIEPSLLARATGDEIKSHPSDTTSLTYAMIVHRAIEQAEEMQHVDSFSRGVRHGMGCRLLDKNLTGSSQAMRLAVVLHDAAQVLDTIQAFCNSSRPDPMVSIEAIKTHASREIERIRIALKNCGF